MDILGQLQARLGIQPAAAEPKPAKLVKFRYWWAAAAVIAVITGISVLLQQVPGPKQTIANKTDTQMVAPAPLNNKENPAGGLSPVHGTIAQTEPKQIVKAPQVIRITESKQAQSATATVTTKLAPVTDNWRAGLQNESSSVRLAAVLASDKTTTLSDNDLKTLYSTMNHDENSNVRLAALEVLKKRDKATNLILQSVEKQDDPLVQIELLASLSPAQAIKVEQQLLDITQNPLTIDAVRNEAYAVLLRSNTNF
ncbi:hypothetical protein [Niabella hibiscisoli]|uniref:hypothetical protein n=1 Tax=Niabella hibiscisoli TaxID=1825928 RepID=UPI001F0F9E0A|nr:hypothetical protein [Niabella hibiscisoli]MCH5718589.1 hypothetical protein [Niabella hibiscisoli]